MGKLIGLKNPTRHKKSDLINLIAQRLSQAPGKYNSGQIEMSSQNNQITLTYDEVNTQREETAGPDIKLETEVAEVKIPKKRGRKKIVRS